MVGRGRDGGCVGGGRMKDDGGPAFPASDTFTNREGDVTTTIHDGMTLRDYFAAKAMQGFFSNSQNHPTRFDPLGNAAWFYLIADAMLAERAKPLPEPPK